MSEKLTMSFLQFPGLPAMPWSVRTEVFASCPKCNGKVNFGSIQGSTGTQAACTECDFRAQSTETPEAIELKVIAEGAKA